MKPARFSDGRDLIRSRINWLLGTEYRVLLAFDFPTFPSLFTGIRLGSSQKINVVLFSVACHILSSPHKYFGFSHLRLGGSGCARFKGFACGNLVESSANPALPTRDFGIESRLVRGLTAA
jgi:hypothetical protein